MVKIVIIGGGPVGMFLALLLSNIYEDIVILEKRKLPFTRNQIVILNSVFLRGADLTGFKWAEYVRTLIRKLNEKGACYSETPTLSLNATCYTNPSDILAVPVKILEESLLEMINEEGKVKIIRSVSNIKIDDEAKIIKYNENKKIKYDMIFGADGNNSEVYKKFKNYYKKKVIIPPKNKKMYGVVFIFKTSKENLNIDYKHQAANLLTRPLMEDKRRFPNARARVFQHQSGIVYMGLAITKKELNLIKKTKGLKIPKEMYKTVESYMKVSDIKVDIEKDLKEISTFPIVVSIITNPVKETKNAVYMLIGDAFFNTHFFIGSALSSHFSHVENIYNQIFYFNSRNDEEELDYNKISVEKDKLHEIFKNYNHHIYVRISGLIQNIIDTPRFSLDVDKIEKKCKKMTIGELKKKGKEYGLNEELMSVFEKKELCMLVMDNLVNANYDIGYKSELRKNSQSAIRTSDVKLLDNIKKIYEFE